MELRWLHVVWSCGNSWLRLTFPPLKRALGFKIGSTKFSRMYSAVPYTCRRVIGYQFTDNTIYHMHSGLLLAYFLQCTSVATFDNCQNFINHTMQRWMMLCDVWRSIKPMTEYFPIRSTDVNALIKNIMWLLTFIGSTVMWYSSYYRQRALLLEANTELLWC